MSLPPFVPSTTAGFLDVKGEAVPVTTASGADTILTVGGKNCVDISGTSNFCLWILNSGSAALSACKVSQSPDGVNWELTDSTTFATLGVGAILGLENSDNARRYLKVEATSSNAICTIFLTGYTA